MGVDGIKLLTLVLQYSDSYYRAVLIDALAATVTPAVTTVTVTGYVNDCHVHRVCERLSCSQGM